MPESKRAPSATLRRSYPADATRVTSRIWVRLAGGHKPLSTQLHGCEQFPREGTRVATRVGLIQHRRIRKV